MGVFRTGWVETTGRSQKGGQRYLVQPNRDRDNFI